MCVSRRLQRLKPSREQEAAWSLNSRVQPSSSGKGTLANCDRPRRKGTGKGLGWVEGEMGALPEKREGWPHWSLLLHRFPSPQPRDLDPTFLPGSGAHMHGHSLQPHKKGIWRELAKRVGPSYRGHSQGAL